MPTSDRFVDGEWYVLTNADGRARSHFYQTAPYSREVAESSCGPKHLIAHLLPSDDIDETKVLKVNPRKRCLRCWDAELRKARRG